VSLVGSGGLRRCECTKDCKHIVSSQSTGCGRVFCIPRAKHQGSRMVLRLSLIGLHKRRSFCGDSLPVLSLLVFPHRTVVPLSTPLMNTYYLVMIGNLACICSTGEWRETYLPSSDQKRLSVSFFVASCFATMTQLEKLQHKPASFFCFSVVVTPHSLLR
jgi:hypothetical protein